MNEAIPAATLIVLRDGVDAPDILMVERAKAMAFAAGALVFPGGRIDTGDVALAATIAPEMADAAARVCAIRETIEEAGVAIGLLPPPAPSAIDAMRDRLHAGDAFGVVLADAGATLDLSALEPFARWRPSHVPARIFDARFYVARLPDDAAAATADGGESVRLVWATAAQVLAEADAGRATIIYPTRRTLERLATFADFAAAIADARAHPVRVITPFVERRDGVAHLCIPEGLGFPVTAEVLTSATRG